MVNYKIVARDGIPESAPWPVSEYAGFDGLEHIHQPLCHHPLQQDVECYEYTTATNTIAAVGEEEGEEEEVEMVTEGGRGGGREGGREGEGDIYTLGNYLG